MNNISDATGFIVKECDFYAAIQKAITSSDFKINEVVQSESKNKAKIRTTIGDFLCESHEIEGAVYMYVYPLPKDESK